MKPERFYVITGGTFVHIAPHFSLAATAYGKVGTDIVDELRGRFDMPSPFIHLIRTRMAAGGKHSPEERCLLKAAGLNHLETNEDLSKLIDYLIGEDSTRCIVMAAAVCDWEPTHVGQPDRDDYASNIVTNFGKDQPRLKTSDGSVSMDLKPADKILRKIREERKDIFLVAFKATAGETPQETYRQGLKVLKQSSANLVFANDVRNHHNMVVTPEEFPYHCTSRKKAIRLLAQMITARTQLDFVRTKMVDNESANLTHLVQDEAVPANFAPVLKYLIENGAYKPFLGKTAGHFGCKILSDTFDFHRISSIRKVDHNNVFEEGMAKIYPSDDGTIHAGCNGKPSVGEHTQSMIYKKLGDDVHSIVHFHCPMKPGTAVPIASQKDYECGSIQCGTNTAVGMRLISLHKVWAVHLEGHGPNIAFHKDVPALEVIRAIEKHWDLSKKSGGLVSS